MNSVPKAQPNDSNEFTMEELRSMPAQFYKYEPITQNQIRLVRLVCTDTPTLQLEFMVVDLINLPDKRFTALSYTWSDQIPEVPCLIGNKILLFTPNVEAFLRQHHFNRALGRSSVTNVLSWYWIDALCINQADTSERSAQVNLMRDIYRESDSVTIWLGHATFRTKQAFEDVKMLCESSKAAEQVFSPASSLADILGHPYWTRSWILQEATTPKPPDKMTVLRGSCYATLRDVMDASRTRAMSTNDTNLPALRNLRVMMSLRREYEDSISLKDLLPMINQLQATDPRDRLFAPAQLCCNAGQFKADYTMTVEEVNTHFAMNYFVEARSLDILAYVALLEEPEMGPSWVPKWNSQDCSPLSAALSRFFPEASAVTPLPEASPLYPTVIESLNAGILPVLGLDMGILNTHAAELAKTMHEDAERVKIWPLLLGPRKCMLGGHNAKSEWTVLVPQRAQPGDHVFAVVGSQYYWVLRRSTRNESTSRMQYTLKVPTGRWRFIGECLMTNKAKWTRGFIARLPEICFSVPWNSSVETIEEACKTARLNWSTKGITIDANWTNLLIE